MDIALPDHDRDTLRRLAERRAEIAALPIQEANRREWTRSNDLVPGKPMVWTREIPWNEIGVPEECECTEPWARRLELGMRQEIHQWDHFPGHMVVEPVVYAPLGIRSTGYGIQVEETAIEQRPGGILSHEYHSIINTLDDVEKIQIPELSEDEDASAEWLKTYENLFGDLLEVRQGPPSNWFFAPWDRLTTWMGAGNVLMRLVTAPDLMHAAMDRVTTAWCAMLDQLEALGALRLNNGNNGIGPGGMCYTSELPRDGFDGEHARPCDLWGHAAAQIFSEVSPEMHEEFALQYERRWLDRFGLTYYGCCEPLDRKVELLSQIPNLRRISMSPWVDIERGAEAVRGRYVFSYKPSPAVLAKDAWDPEWIARDLRETFERLRGCAAEVIMKDISTINYRPEWLYEWTRIATEVAEEFA